MIKKILKKLRVLFGECKYDDCTGRTFDWANGYFGLNKKYCKKCGRKQYGNTTK